MNLYWYLKSEYADAFFATGAMYFGHCGAYESEQLTTAQRDTEQKRSATFRSGTTRIFVGKSRKEAHEIPFISITASCTLPNYFLRSLSLEYRRSMLREFGANACIEFTDPRALIAAVTVAVSEQLNTGPWRFIHSPVNYISPEELMDQNGVFARVIAKDRTKYGSQKEFRLALVPEHRFPENDAPGLVIRLHGVEAFSRRLL